MRGPLKLQRGFSLVEIVLAIGIISFAMVSLLGLMSVLFTNSKESRDDTLIPAMARKVVEEMRAESANNFPPTSNTFYFTGDGTATANQSNSVYKCTIAAATGSTTYPVAPSGTEPVNLNGTLFRFTMTFKWPESAPDANANTYVIPASIAKYD